MQLPFIQPQDRSYRFPDVEFALEQPNGLLAFGGDLSPERLLAAYKKGIFPWFSADQPILWWSPNPRLVLFPEKIHIARSLIKAIGKTHLQIRFDTAFKQVIDACSQPRSKQQGTWITAEIQQAYHQLHLMGHAHSFEAWDNNQLVGGLYGIALGQVFFGESMFSRQTNASKIAFVKAVELLKMWNFKLIDCQVETEHLQSFAAENITRLEFSELINHLTLQRPATNAWQPAK